MKYLRSFIFNIYFILASGLYGLFCLCIFLFLKQETRYAMIKFFCKCFVWVCEKVCGIRYHVDGLANLEAAYKAHPNQIFIASKHQSTWETLALFAILPVRVCFVLKKELTFIPIFGWVLALLDMLHIDRKKGRAAFLFLSKHMSQKLQKSYVPLMFPEGTRTKPQEVVDYKLGAAKLAHQNNTQVILIAHNAGVYYPKTSYIKTSGCIQIKILPAFAAKSFSNAELLNAHIKSQIEAACLKI